MNADFADILFALFQIIPRTLRHTQKPLPPMEFAKILMTKLDAVAREQEKDELLCKKLQEVRKNRAAPTSAGSIALSLSPSKPFNLISPGRPSYPIDRRIRCWLMPSGRSYR